MWAYVRYIAALLLFGSNGIVASHILLNSYDIVFLRTLIGSIFLIALYFILGGRFREARDKKMDLVFIAISGAAMGANWMFLYEAYARVGVSVASLANYCGPVVVIALSPLFLKEKLTPLKITVFMVVIIGMFLVSGRDLAVNGGLSWGLACGLISAVMYAFMVLFNMKAKFITGLENSTLQLFFAFVTCAAFIVAKQGFWLPPIRQSIVPILFLGVVNTGIGCYLYFSSIGRLQAGVVAICGYLEPLSALVFSAIFLRERLTPVQLLGALLIIGGAMFYTIVNSRMAAKK